MTPEAAVELLTCMIGKVVRSRRLSLRDGRWH